MTNKKECFFIKEFNEAIVNTAYHNIKSKDVLYFIRDIDMLI